MTQLDRRALIASAASAAALAAAPAARAQAPEWETWPEMPWPAQEIYAALWGGRIAVRAD